MYRRGNTRPYMLLESVITLCISLWSCFATFLDQIWFGNLPFHSSNGQIWFWVPVDWGTPLRKEPLNYIFRNWCFYCLPCKILDHQPQFTPFHITSPIILWSTFSLPPLIFIFVHYSSGIPEISNLIKHPMLSCKDHRSKIYSTICSPFFTHRHWTTT
jgi:hypothetical protein